MGQHVVVSHLVVLGWVTSHLWACLVLLGRMSVGSSSGGGSVQE
jgi:hypothetical protein